MLEEDAYGQVGRATTLEQLSCQVEIDVGAHCEVSRRGRVVPGPHELLGTPPLDALQLGLEDFFCRRHHAPVLRIDDAWGSPLLVVPERARNLGGLTFLGWGPSGPLRGRAFPPTRVS